MSIYFHGGPAGIRGRIEPASKTGARNATDLLPGTDTSHVRRDRIFLTTDYAAAVLFACAHRKPMVYIVAPDDELEPDPDCLGEPGLSWQTTGGTIVRTVKPTRQQIATCRAALFEATA